MGADSPSLFAGERYGNFRYSVPVDAAGNYTVRLLFAETWFGTKNDDENGRPGSRLFDVLCNGVKLLDTFDIFTEAGGSNRALLKEFRSLNPNVQGVIELSFVPIENYAAINAIEIIQE